ncbi:hypothetical protein HBI26_186090 [Parastagonospora nodorum]|nr:hypothetical protein HBI26_186090 [Parastagonospora nodorum]
MPIKSYLKKQNKQAYLLILLIDLITKRILKLYILLAEEAASYYYSKISLITKLFLKGCIITNSNTIKQISNAFLLVIVEKLYCTITKTLKVFN